jgi:hypothetical protein
LGLGIQNDDQAATYLRENGYGHHPVLSRTLLYIIHISAKGGRKGGTCGGMRDYRVVEAQTELDILREAPKQDLDAIQAAMERLRVAIAKRDQTFKLKSEASLGRVAATKPFLVLQLVSAVGAERELQFTPRKSRCKNDILAVLVNEKSVKEFNSASKGWMTAWVEAAEASKENSLTFKTADSRTAKKLRADNEDFEWKLSIHSTEDTIPHEAVPVEMEIRAVDKDFRVKRAATRKPQLKRKASDQL